MILEPEPGAAPPASRGSSIEEILEEVEEERRQSTAQTGPRSEAGARDLTLRLEDSDIGAGGHEAPGSGRRPGERISATEVLESPEAPPPAPPARPSPPPPPEAVPPTSVLESPREEPPPLRRVAASPAAAPARTATAPARPVARPEAAEPAKASSISPAVLGIAAVLLVGGAVTAWLVMRGGGAAEPEPPATEEPAVPAPASPPPPAAAPAEGFVAVDAQPWAEVVEVRESGSGRIVDLARAAGADPTTPIVLSLAEGTYEIKLRHPEYGEVSIAGVRVSAGATTSVFRALPGFSYSSMMPSVP
jgi:hypothetical protein